MYGYGFGQVDMWYYVLVIVSTVLGLATQSYIQNTYRKWAKVPASTGETGAEVARRMLDSNGADEVGIVRIAGTLTDNYDPRDNMLHLSDDNLNGGSVASVAVACHEAGHALQKATNYQPMNLRSALVPVVNFASGSWMIVFFIGASLGMMGLVRIALVLFACSVLFQIVTLPVEFDASARAVKYIETSSGLNEEALAGAKNVLFAAALTYVAAALVSVLQFLYYYSRVNGSRRRG